MKHLYTKLIVSLAALTLISGLTTIASTVQGANIFNMGGDVYECTDPTADGYDVDQNKCYSWCFVRETKVTMADGTLKNIEDVIVGDWLKGSIGPNRVEYLIRKFNPGKIYGFNGGKPFVTDSHPFMTTDGWKSIDPEATKLGHPGVEVEKLEVGDILITENGNVELTSIIGVEDPQKVYTFGVNGTHDYYADGFLVHNKYPPNNPCPAGWFSLEDAIYDWNLSTSPQNGYNCFGRDLGAPVLIGSGGGASPMADIDIMSMIYWDKDQDGIYDNGTDRPIIMPTYAINNNGNTGFMYLLNNPLYFTGAGFRWNNAINLLYQGTYNFGISKSSSAWTNLAMQGFTTNDPTTGSALATGGVGYITGMQVGMEYTCNGTGSQTVSFIEYSCPSGYNAYGSSCWTGSTVAGGPCTSNADCTSPGTCAGYSYTPPNSDFKYNDAGPWNASHPNWNDTPHGNPGGYCRNGDDAIGCLPNDPNQDPNWYGGGLLCGCQNFIPNNDGITTYGSCTTSSSQTIPATEVTVAESVTCTGTGGGCVPNRTCSSGFTLTGDTNGDGTPNCLQTTCVNTTGSTPAFEYLFDRQQPAAINVGCQAVEDGYSQSCGASFWIVTCSIGETASTDVTVTYDFRNGGQQCGPINVTIPNGSSQASTNVSCGCAIAATPEGEQLVGVSPTSMNGKRFWPHFIYQTSTGVDISADIDSCGCNAGSLAECSTSTGVVQLDGTYNYCYDSIWGAGGWDFNIFGPKTSTTIPTGQTVCSTQTAEATDLNNCSGCVTTTESPTVCDINDPLMAGVCYIPGGFGSTLMVDGSMVGINTSTPGYALDVAGIARSAQILTLSDARLKTSIEKIDGALEKIRQINGYSFEWKKDGKPDFGVLAQEIEKIFKDAVDTDANGLKTVQYAALLAPIIEAIHEINSQIDTLSNEKFDAQSKRIEAIEAKIQ